MGSTSGVAHSLVDGFVTDDGRLLEVAAAPGRVELVLAGRRVELGAALACDVWTALGDALVVARGAPVDPR